MNNIIPSIEYQNFDNTQKLNQRDVFETEFSIFVEVENDRL